jgi:hypothetical protein
LRVRHSTSNRSIDEIDVNIFGEGAYTGMQDPIHQSTSHEKRPTAYAISE